jgi:hypothetical protein
VVRFLAWVAVVALCFGVVYVCAPDYAWKAPTTSQLR